jgi:hypothetical protein
MFEELMLNNLLFYILFQRKTMNHFKFWSMNLDKDMPRITTTEQVSCFSIEYLLFSYDIYINRRCNAAMWASHINIFSLLVWRRWRRRDCVSCGILMKFKFIFYVLKVYNLCILARSTRCKTEERKSATLAEHLIRESWTDWCKD